MQKLYTCTAVIINWQSTLTLYMHACAHMYTQYVPRCNRVTPSRLCWSIAFKAVITKRRRSWHSCVEDRTALHHLPSSFLLLSSYCSLHMSQLWCAVPWWQRTGLWKREVWLLQWQRWWETANKLEWSLLNVFFSYDCSNCLVNIHPLWISER